MRVSSLLKALWLLPLAGAIDAAEGPLYPSPQLAPAQVVRIQLEALARNDEPRRDAGIELSFRFVSPASQSINGPLARFSALVHGPVYSPMLNHRQARYGPTLIEDDSAQLPVLLVSAAGERVGYLFTLSRQPAGQCGRCWLTDSVVRFDVADEEGEAWLMM